MGTRSTVKFYSEHADENSKPLVCIYQQYDGYLDGVGHSLANFLKDIKVLNGFNSTQQMADGFANGMGCLAAQYIASIKTKIGGVYIADLDDTEQFNYAVRLIDGKLFIEVNDFKGTPADLLIFKESEE